MKKLAPFLISLTVLAVGAFAQTPDPSASVSPAIPTPTAIATASVPASPAATVSASPASSSSGSDIADRIHKKFDQKFGKKHGVHISVDKDKDEDDEVDKAVSKATDDVPAMVIPLVGVIMIILFGTPVLAMALLLYFGFSKTRMMHRTVRMMVEKGQPVPEALLNPPPHVRKRSDMRRGVVLMMVGTGLLVFFGAVNDWENGAWSIGLIPLLIGVGYLMVWKLEGKPDAQPKADNPPPLP